MNILEIVSGTAVNGAVVTCLETARAMQARGHRVTVVARPGAWILSQLTGSGIEAIESSLKRWPLRELRRVAKIVREREIDVIHTHMSSASFFGVLLRALTGVPSVATAHNRYIQLHWMFNDRVVAVSEATRRFHHRFNLVRRQRIEVVHNFINYARFAGGSPEAGQALRAAWGLQPTDRVMTVIGDVIPRKGLLYLIRALPAIVQALPSARLVCVGHLQHAYCQQVRAEAERLQMSPYITWTGPRSDIEAVLLASDLYVLPSLEENLPLSILEAMAARRAVVATSVGGIPECVIPGETGLLVPPRQPAPLADAIVRALGDDDMRQRWGLAGQRLVAERFTLESHLKQIERIFDSVHRRAA